MTNQNSFLGDMQTIVKGEVECLTRYEIDNGSKGGSIWVTKPNTGKNPNIIGNEIIKIKMPFEMFDQLKAKQEAGEIKFPEHMEILCSIDMGGQNKAVLTALSIKKIVDDDKPEPAPIADQNIDKATGEIKDHQTKQAK